MIKRCVWTYRVCSQGLSELTSALIAPSDGLEPLWVSFSLEVRSASLVPDWLHAYDSLADGSCRSFIERLLAINARTELWLQNRR